MENLKSNSINDNYYWELLFKINWYRLTKLYGTKACDHLKDYCIIFLSKEEIKNLNNFIVDRKIELKEKIKSYIKSSSSESRKHLIMPEEDFDNKISYIVGLGRTMYDFITDNINLFFSMPSTYAVNSEIGLFGAAYEKK